jgi:chromosome partitioning protein
MAGKVLAIANEKGGVGKTTCSVQLARELAARGKQVCIIDNDPSYDATSALFGDDIPDQIALGVKPEGYSNSVKLYAADSAFEPCEVTENLYVMGATDALSVLKGAELEPAYDFVDSIEILRENLDYIIIDCAPSFGLLFTAAMIAAANGEGGVVIPVIPDDLSFKAAKKVASRIEQMNQRLKLNLAIVGVLPNKVVNNPMPQSVRSYLCDMEEEFGPLMFKTHINQTVKIADATSLQEKVSTYARASSKPAKQIAAFTDEVIKRLEKLHV